jgi:putative Mg2+ transporter-C (MgtC) family protein
MQIGSITLQQLTSLTLTILFCGLIGVEREYHDKDAGIRTNILVGLGSWLFTMTSLYGIDAIHSHDTNWDRTRIAAQVVSGIGFIGAGVIFYQRDNVRGLTTAAGIWLAAAIGMTAAYNLLILATITTSCYFMVIILIAPLAHKLMRRSDSSTLSITYENGKGSLRTILLELGRTGLSTQVTSIRKTVRYDWSGATVTIRISGGVTPTLLDDLMKVHGVKDIKNEKDPTF